MKKRLRKYLPIIITLLAIIAIVLSAKFPVFYISSCVQFSGLEIIDNINIVPGSPVFVGECPPEAEEPTPVSSGSSNSGSSSSTISGGSGVSTTISPQNQTNVTSPTNTTNNSAQLSPPIIEQNDSSQVNKSKSLDRVVLEFISRNKLDLDCRVYVEEIQDNAYVVILKGYRKTSVLGLKIRVPYEAKIVVHDGKVILECTKQPWWGKVI